LQLEGGGKGAVPANADEGVQVQAAAGFPGLVKNFPGDLRLLSGADLGDKAAPVGGAEDRSAEMADVGHGDGIEALVTDGVE